MRELRKSWTRVGTCIGAGVFLALGAVMSASATGPETGETSAWAVRLEPGTSPEVVAAAAGASEWRQIGSLPDTYLLRFDRATATTARSSTEPDRGERLAAIPGVVWEEAQVGRLRFPRGEPTAEPLYADQWHLANTGQHGGLPGVDLNVEGVWALGYEGSGVGVSVVDTGTAWDHPDLLSNYVKGLDLWDNDSDARPVVTDENHGTAVAGIILEAANGIDGTGVAPAAGLYPMRLLREGAAIPDSDEAEALGGYPNEVFVSNNSWGPSDDTGVSLAAIGSLVKSTFQNSDTARGGRGTLYAWAAGNGREDGQRADYDGYNVDPHTISVAAIGQDGQVAAYSEPGGCVFIAAPSRGAGRGILTTDRIGSAGYSAGNTTRTFSGTSAATPMVSGVLALVLEANPLLGWRDVQHILARTAQRTDWDDAGWSANGGGFFVSEDYGFGRIDALGAVRLAERWTNRPAAQTAVQSSFSALAIGDQQTATRSLAISQSLVVEHVEVTLAINHSQWRQLEISLVSPRGTRVYFSRPFATQSGSFGTFTFTTPHFWGETSAGQWKVEIKDTEAGTSGSLSSVTLRIYGTPGSAAPAPSQFKTTLVADEWPLALAPGDWVFAPAGESSEILSVEALERGRVWEADGTWWFEPPADGYGRFPLGMTVAASGGEARNFLVFVERPSLATDGQATPSLAGLGATGNLLLQPRLGTLGDNGGGVTYFPDAAHALFAGADRFSLGPVGRFDEVSVPVLFGRDWSVETDGRDAVVKLGLGSTSLDSRFTVEGWFRPDAWGEADTGFGRLFDKDTFLFFLNGYDHGFYNDASLVVFTDYADGSSGAFMTAPGSIALGEWVHVAVTFDYLRNPQVRVYFNGVEAPTNSPADLSPPSAGPRLASNSGAIATLGDNAAGTRGYRGGFNDVRVWSSVRTPAQILGAAQGAEPDAPSTLLARLDPAVTDRSSEVLAGTASTTAQYVGVRWSARQSPWAALRQAFPRAEERGLGWWEMSRSDEFYGDAFPWVYFDDLGWIWANPEAGLSRWFFHRADLGWIYWTDDTLPWIYAPSRGAWLYHLTGTRWCYDATLGEWFQLPS